MIMPNHHAAKFILALALVAMTTATTRAFRCPSVDSSSRMTPAYAQQAQFQLNAYYKDNTSGCVSTSTTNRRSVTTILARGLVLGVPAATIGTPSSHALVEGNPPLKTNTKKALGEEYRQGTAAMSSSVEAEVLPREAYKKLDSGVIYADITVGSGEQVREGSKLNIQWVLRRPNGYFVDSSAVSDSVPFIFTLGDPNGAIAGLDEGVRGMRAGGTRRILIPPRLAWVKGLEDGKPGPLPAGFGPRQQMRRIMKDPDVPGAYIFLEVKLSRVRSGSDAMRM